MNVTYFLIFLIYINEAFLYFKTQKQHTKLMTELIVLQDLSTKFLTNQTLQALIDEKIPAITAQVKQQIDPDLETLVQAINDITTKLNAL